MAPYESPISEPLLLNNSYLELPEVCYQRIAPTPVAQPHLIRLNEPLAERLGLDTDALASAAGIARLAGNRVPDGAEPLALAYAGHQYANFVPSLGDGRAVLLGELPGPTGAALDLQLKGGGRTAFSRMGDGRASLGPVVREYVVSEAMAAFGIPTTRSLGILGTGEAVDRDGPEPGGILPRLAASHLRVGTFEYFLHRGDIETLRRLAEYTIDRHYPEARAATNPFRGLLEAVVNRSADLIAQWQGVGFIHGVMNTDNMTLSGETLDYGPCAFMDTYHPSMVYSSIDYYGRYAYDQQPKIGHWNLARFAEALLPLWGDDQEAAVAEAKEVLEGYVERFQGAYQARFREKLGLAEARTDDAELMGDLLKRMAEQQADFTLTFRGLADLAVGDASGDGAVSGRFADPSAFAGWAERWRARLRSEGRDEAERQAAMRAINPAFIPRNHRVEQVIEALTQRGDTTPLDELLQVVTQPFDDHPPLQHYAEPPRPDEVVQRTFCGT